MSGSLCCRACAAAGMEAVRPPSEDAGFGPSPSDEPPRAARVQGTSLSFTGGDRSWSSLGTRPCRCHRATGVRNGSYRLLLFLDAALLSASGRQERSRPPALAGRRREGRVDRNRVLGNVCRSSGSGPGFGPGRGKVNHRQVLGSTVFFSRLRTVGGRFRKPERGEKVYALKGNHAQGRHGRPPPATEVGRTGLDDGARPRSRVFPVGPRKRLYRGG